MVKKIVIMYDVFRTICEYSSKYSNFQIPKEKWVECMGYLLCDNPKPGDMEYIVRKAIGMASGSEMRVEIPLDELSKIEKIIDENPSLFLGGWWHTHPGLSIFFSDTDIKNQSFYQQHNEDGLGIVFDLEMIGENFIGFKIFRNDSKESTSYHEVEYELRDFTEYKLKEALSFIKGIPDWLIHNLSINYGFKEGNLLKFNIDDITNENLKLNFEIENLSKIEDSSELGYKYDEIAHKFHNKNDIENAIYSMIISAKYFENAKEYENAIDSYLDAIKFIIDSKEVNKTYIAYPIFEKLDQILEGNMVEAKEYFKAKKLYIEGLIKELELNYSISAEKLRKSLELFDPQEDFEESYFAAKEISLLMKKMNFLDISLKYMQIAKNFVKLIINDTKNMEEYSDEIDWKSEFISLDKEIKKLSENITSSKLKKII